MSHEVPDGWRPVALGDFVDVNPESLPSSTDGDFSFLYIDVATVDGPSQMLEPRRVRFCDAPSRARRKVRHGDILVSTVRPYLRSFCRVQDQRVDLVASTGFAVLRPRGDVDGSFLNQHVLSDWFVEHLIPRMKGSNYPAVSPQDVADYSFALPPLPEQRQIAEILSSVDEAIQTTQAVIDQSRTVKQEVLERLLTKGIGHTRFKQTEIGEIPESWKVVRIGDVAVAKGGKRMPKGRPFADEITPYPYLRVSDFKNGTISRENLVYVCPEDRKHIQKYTISSDDIYISIAGTIGSVGMVPHDLNGAQLTENAAKIVIHDTECVGPEFLMRVMSGKAIQKQMLAAKGIGGGVPKLALFRIEQMQFGLPEAIEQDAILKHLRPIDKVLLGHEDYLAGLKGMKAALMSDLLTGRVRVSADLPLAAE